MALATASVHPSTPPVATPSPRTQPDDYDMYEDEFYGSKAPTPNAIRGKIRKFLTETGMKVSSLVRCQRELPVLSDAFSLSSGSQRRFLLVC